jgi:hypothetical protein
MTATVISHHKPRRKRAGAGAWTARRLLALAVALAGIAAAAWVTPYLRQAPARFPDAQLPPASVSPPLPEALEITGEPVAPPQPSRTARRRNGGIPLDGQAEALGEDYEVLSAAELDAISQARAD